MGHMEWYNAYPLQIQFESIGLLAQAVASTVGAATGVDSDEGWCSFDEDFSFN